MIRLLVILILIFHTHESARADLRVKVRSTPFYDVEIKLGENQKNFVGNEATSEHIVYLSTNRISENEIFEICYKARQQTAQPNAKNLALVQMDYLGRGQEVQNIRSLSPTGDDFVAGKRSCEKYSFKLINDAGVDTYEITAIEETTPAPNLAQVFEPIQAPPEDEISANEARLEMLKLLEKDSKECKDGDQVVNCAEAIAKIETEIETMKARVPASQENPEAPSKPLVAEVKPTPPPAPEPKPIRPIMPLKVNANPPETSWWSTLSESDKIFVLTAFLSFIFLMTASLWRVFTKAGQTSSYSLIPLWNLFTLWKISQTSAVSLYLIFFPCIFITFGNKSLPPEAARVLYAVIYVGFVIINFGVAKQFNRGRFFGLGLSLMPFLFFPFLGFYERRTHKSAAPGPAPAGFDQAG